MRSGMVVTAAATLLAIFACRSDGPLAPTRTGTSDRNPDVPSGLFANFTKVDLSGTGIVVDINDDGEAVGTSDGIGALWHGPAHTKSDLPIFPVAIARDGTIAGNVDGHAAVWKDGNAVVLDTAPSTAFAICRCPAGTVVGSVVVNGQKHAAIWAGGVRIDAGLPDGGTSAEFTGVANGFVVGNADVPTLNPGLGTTEISTQAFAWSHATGWRQLASGALASVVWSVNANGTSVGWQRNILDPDLLGVMYDSAGGRIPLFGDPSFLRSILPVAVNDSGTMAANFPHDAIGNLALVATQGGTGVLPPGNPGDVATSINSSEIIGGASGGKPVLWVPNL
jgi:hypothetical protein